MVNINKLIEELIKDSSKTYSQIIIEINDCLVLDKSRPLKKNLSYEHRISRKMGKVLQNLYLKETNFEAYQRKKERYNRNK